MHALVAAIDDDDPGLSEDLLEVVGFEQEW
jgi:hypothetical protein